jgi:hypothetical protein
VALAVPVLAGCSSSTATPSTTPPTTATTATAPGSLPATGSVDGLTLAVTSSPATGTVGHTAIQVTAVLKGAVNAGSLRFQVSDSPAGDQGKPASTQTVEVSKPGTYTMPRPYSPSRAGSWAVTVTYSPQDKQKSILSVSGQPPVAGQPAPFPQLVTVVTGG